MLTRKTSSIQKQRQILSFDREQKQNANYYYVETFYGLAQNTNLKHT